MAEATDRELDVPSAQFKTHSNLAVAQIANPFRFVKPNGPRVSATVRQIFGKRYLHTITYGVDPSMALTPAEAAFNAAWRRPVASGFGWKYLSGRT